ncbi:energy-coupled thiamine transporter ThiT [Metabacillus fastidiosus]|uniref:energy-coupled thiamine transporter ThiT n=1 Tax=Metabacillus fastidiosus TaxID=1458 RepID=UPI003D27D717
MESRERLLFIIEVAMLSALAFLLDLVSGIIGNFWPQGGSISLAMIPIFILSFRWGLKGGLLSGLLLGLLQVTIGKSQVTYPLQGFIDYFLAFSLVGMAGIFAKQVRDGLNNKKKNAVILYITLGTFIGCLLRLSAHVLSGVYFFAHYAPKNTPVWAFSIGYNSSYMIPTFIVGAVVTSLIVLTAPRLILRKI